MKKQLTQKMQSTENSFVDTNLQEYDAVQGIGGLVEMSASCVTNHQSKQHSVQLLMYSIHDWSNSQISCSSITVVNWSILI